MLHRFSENPVERRMFERLREQETETFYNPENIEIILEEGGEERLKESDFSDIYDKGEIERDRTMVSVLKRKFERDLDHLNPEEIRKIEEKKEWSEALEVIITQRGSECGWFGDDAYLVRATEYDDLVNGLDGVLEFAPAGKTSEGKEKVRRLVLAIDASMQPALDNVRRKINRNLDHLTGRGDKLQVKYFESVVDGFRGRLDMVVPVVVGIDAGNTNRLIGLFAEMIKLGNIKTKDRNVLERHQRQLSKAQEHPAQRAFLEEIRMQLDCYLSLLENRTDEASKLYKEEISALLDKIKAVIKEKGHIREDGATDLSGISKDSVLRSIRKALPPKKRKHP